MMIPNGFVSFSTRFVLSLIHIFTFRELTKYLQSLQTFIEFSFDQDALIMSEQEYQEDVYKRQGADRAVNYHSDHEGTQLNYEVLSEAVSAVRCSVPLGTNCLLYTSRCV